MSKAARAGAFSLPPHENAEVHKHVMAELARMTPEQVFQSAVKAGIYAEDGELTKPYRNGESAKPGSRQK